MAIMDALAVLPRWGLAAVFGVLGLFVGSFLNVVVARLPVMLDRRWRAECADYLGQGQEDDAPAFNLATPSSHCPACQAPVRPWHNVPLLGYAWLRGRCADCGERISPRYPLLEALTGAMFAALAWQLGLQPLLAGGLLLSAGLVALGCIDAQTRLLPDDLTLPLLWAGLLFHLFWLPATLADVVLGAAVGYLLLWLVYQLFHLLTGKEGMGYGDFKLLAALGAWLGWQMLPLVVLLSSLLGSLIGIALIVAGRHGRGQPLPFGPYLAMAGWVALVWGQDIMRWYLGG